MADPGKAVWFALAGTASVVTPMLVQFAFWPRGAIYRQLVFVLPLLLALALPAAVITDHMG